MIPPSFMRLAPQRARAVLAEADRERLIDQASGRDRSHVVVATIVLAAIVFIVVAALLLRSIFMLAA